MKRRVPKYKDVTASVGMYQDPSYEKQNGKQGGGAGDFHGAREYTCIQNAQVDNSFESEATFDGESENCRTPISNNAYYSQKMILNNTLEDSYENFEEESKLSFGEVRNEPETTSKKYSSEGHN